jgi:methylamine dehydrogenase accessory protein MauD
MNVFFVASYATLWLLVAALLLAVLVLARQVGLIHRRIPPIGARMGNPGPEVGAQVPDLKGVDVHGRPVELGVKHGKRTLVVFVAPSCPACAELAPALVSIAKSERSTLEVILVTPRGDEKEALTFAKKYKLESLPLLVSPEATQQFQVSSTPYALLIDEAGVLRAKGLVNNIDHLESLLTALAIGHPTMESFAAANGNGHAHTPAADSVPVGLSQPRA